MILNKLLALSLGVMIVGCGSKNVAKDYMDNSGKAAADATPADQTGDQTPATGEDDNTDQTGEMTGEETETPVGDAAKGKAAMVACAACHNANGLAKAVTLNATAIPRLDEAYNGAQKAIHSVYSEVFEQPGRADLEAALKEIK